MQLLQGPFDGLFNVARGGRQPAEVAYSVIVTGSGGGITQKTTLTLNIPGFTLTASASSSTLAPNQKSTITVTAKGAGGFTSPVSLAIAGLPAGVTAAFSPQPAVSSGTGASVLTLTRGAATGTSTTALAVTATGGGISKTLGLTLNMTAK